MSKYSKHKEKWTDCEKCELCHGRTKVVLCRGEIPADILFIGEAPGASEDVLGRPFAGPAGVVLNDIIQQSWPVDEENDGDVPQSVTKFSICLTNLVSCIPRDETGVKLHEPPKHTIEACRERLDELVEMCKPRLIVRVGKLTQKKYDEPEQKFCDIMHPAAILRSEVSQRGLHVQRNIAILSDAIFDLL